MAAKKPCLDCGRTKLLSQFHRNRGKPDGRQSWCKECHNKRAREWRRKRGPGYYQERLQRNPNYFRNHKLRAAYGITVQDYDAMFKAQGGKCAICRQPQKRKARTGQPMRLQVDHCHKTGKVRGLLCMGCNTSLGHLERADWVQRAQNYLGGKPICLTIAATP